MGRLPANPQSNLHSDLTSICLCVTWTSKVISIVQTDALQPAYRAAPTGRCSGYSSEEPWFSGIFRVKELAMKVLECSSGHFGVSGDVQASSTPSLKLDPEKQCVRMTSHHLCSRWYPLMMLRILWAVIIDCEGSGVL